MSDLVVITPEVVNEVEKAVNFFNVSDIRRKNRFLFQYMQDYYFKQKLPFDKMLLFCRQIQNNEHSFAVLLDNIYVFSQVLQSDARRLLVQLLQHLVDRLTPNQRIIFFDQIDEETLAECGFINSEQFRRRRQKINTDINFFQYKFCYLKDENEGYSKLMVEVLECQQLTHPTDQEVKLSNIISLIGYFDLDPDRVVDLIVQCWIESPYSLTYVRILNHFKRISVSQFLSKRFEQILHTIVNSNLGIQFTPLASAATSLQTDTRVPPQNLILVTALSLKFNLFNVGNIWKYLQPSDQEICKACEDIFDESFKYYKSFDQLMQIEEVKDAGGLGQGERSEKIKRDLMNQQLYNQKFWLLQGLLETNSIGIFYEVYKIFEEGLDLTCFYPIRQTMARLIEWMIDPIYESQFNAAIFPSRKRQQQTFTFIQDCPTEQISQHHVINEEFIAQIRPLLEIFKPYLGHHPVLFHKLVKLFTNSESANSFTESYFLAALSGCDSLPIVQEIWKHLAGLDYRKRYSIYSKFKDKALFLSVNQVIRAAEFTKTQLRAFFNKIDKENKDRMMMKFAKLCHNQPFLIMNQLRRNRLEISDNNAVLVHALGYVTPLGLDIMMFTFVQWLSDFREESRIRERDIECTEWFKNITSFIALCLRKYTNIDMQGLFAYMLDVFTDNNKNIKPEILILRELIEKMTGIVHIHDLTPQQIQALAGGRYIQLETTSQTNEYRKSRKSCNALERFFWTQTITAATILNQDNEEEVVSLAFLILIVLCQQRSIFLLNYNTQHIKPLAALYDNYTCSINQLTKYLLFQTDTPNHYAKLFPKTPLYRMVIHFSIPFETAFYIIRYGYERLYHMSEDAFQHEVTQIKEIYDKIDAGTMYRNPDYGDLRYPQVPAVIHNYVKDQVWNYLNPEMFAIFWLLSLDHIYVPTAVYEQQNKQMAEVQAKATDAKDRQEKQKVKLKEELDNNLKRKQLVDEFLDSKKSCFSIKGSGVDDENRTKFSQILSQVCLLPRILIDPGEAIYCAKFVHILLRIICKIKPTLAFYIPREVLFNTLSYLQCATEQECQNLSLFMQQLILPYANWNDEVRCKNDLKTYLDVTLEITEKQKRFMVVIFYRIMQFIKILRQNETHVRNALLFLKRVQDVFPPTQSIAEEIKIYLQEMEKEYGHIPDIKTQIKNYHIDEKILRLPKGPPPKEQNRQGVAERKELGQNSKLVGQKGVQQDQVSNSKQEQLGTNGKKYELGLNSGAKLLGDSKKRSHDRDSKEKKKKSYERERGPKKQPKL